MNKKIVRSLIITVFMLAILLIGCTPSSEPSVETTQLATAKVRAQLSPESDLAIITGHNDLTYFVDSSPSSEGLQVIDTLLAAQATCAVFVAEKAAQELDVTLDGATATSLFNDDAQQVQVYLDLPGANSEQVLELANNFRQRCPIYTTLSEAKSVEFTPGEQFESPRDGESVVTATLFQFGKANVSTHDNTFVMDSVPPLDGPNEELNPLDMMLGGLAACSAFAYENEFPNRTISVNIEGDFNPTGVRDLDGENPRIQDIRINMLVDEYDEVKVNKVEEQIKENCYLYNTLNGTVNIKISTELLNS